MLRNYYTKINLILGFFTLTTLFMNGITTNKNNQQRYSGKDLQISGHRAMGSEMPENTIAAFKAALEQKLDFVETDLWLTKDGVIVVIHGNHDLGECKMMDINTKEKKNVWITKMNYTDLKDLVYVTSGDSVPTLEQVLSIFKGGTTKINLEFKDWHLEVVKKTLDMVFKFDMADQIFFSSFNHKISIVIQNELEKMNRPKNTFGFGYLVNRFFNVPQWEKMKETLNPGIDYINMDGIMMHAHEEEFVKVREEADKYGVSMGVFFSMRMAHHEKDPLFDQAVRTGVKLVITNAPTLLMDYRSKKRQNDEKSDL